MAAETLSQGERFRARRTRVRLFSGMEALVPPEDLPPAECFPADAARVSISGATDDRLEAPYVICASGEAAQAMASVKTLMTAEIFWHRPTVFEVNAVSFGSVALNV